jgi:membrane protein DedA with SNARE-associated domain
MEIISSLIDALWQQDYVRYFLGKTPLFLKYEDLVMNCLMLLPVLLLIGGLIGSIVVLWRKKHADRQNKGKSA